MMPGHLHFDICVCHLRLIASRIFLWPTTVMAKVTHDALYTSGLNARDQVDLG